MLKNASIKEIVKNTIVKFTSRTFFLSAIWVFVAMFILIRDGDMDGYEKYLDNVVKILIGTENENSSK